MWWTWTGEPWSTSPSPPHPQRERKAFVRGFLTKIFWTKPLPNPFLSLLGLLLSILSLWVYPHQRLLSPVPPFSVFLVRVVLGFVFFSFVFQACLLYFILFLLCRRDGNWHSGQVIIIPILSQNPNTTPNPNRQIRFNIGPCQQSCVTSMEKSSRGTSLAFGEFTE